MNDSMDRPPWFPMSRRSFLRSTTLAGSAVAFGGMTALSDAFAQTAEPKKGGTLRVAVPGGAADSLDPHRTQGQVSDIVRFTNLFDGLTEYTPDAEIRLVLAETFTPNEAADEWIVKLRNGIKCHDGREFTADDVIFSVKRLLDPANPTKGASLIRFVDADRLEKVDSHTVRFRLKQAYGPFKDVWANRYLRMVPANFDPAKPVGTGPFRVQAFTAGQQSTFERFDGYFREPAFADRLVIVNINENAASINALRGGQVDISYSLPFAEARTIESNPRLKLLNNPSGLYIPIYMRTDIEPFNDVRVRKAMRLIADRNQLVKVALAGFGETANDMVGRYTTCGVTDVPKREQNIAEAKALLEAAGKSNLSVELAAVNGTAGMVECAQVFAQQAKAAGVNITVRVLDQGAYLAKYAEWPMGVDFLNDTYLALAARSLLPSGTFNTTHWNDPEFVELANKAFATSDDAKRCDIVNKMRAIEWERGGNIVWGFANILNAYSAKVNGLTPYKVDSALYHLRMAWLA